MGEIFYHYLQRPLRKMLRGNMPEPERRLWYAIRKRRFMGLKFRRQTSIGRYVVDFYCHDLRLIVEVDGDSHYGPTAQVYDRERDEYLRSLGLKVLRFTNLEVMGNLEGVLEKLQEHLSTHSPPHGGGDEEGELFS